MGRKLRKANEAGSGEIFHLFFPSLKITKMKNCFELLCLNVEGGEGKVRQLGFLGKATGVLRKDTFSRTDEILKRENSYCKQIITI